MHPVGEKRIRMRHDAVSAGESRAHRAFVQTRRTATVAVRVSSVVAFFAAFPRAVTATETRYGRIARADADHLAGRRALGRTPAGSRRIAIFPRARHGISINNTIAAHSHIGGRARVEA